ncbi:hypothetical protein [Halarchaeum nitratireducens]|uniref:Uncharacterized protein n=1 Tax=Halarchaeum nitratireducens TaxID=489913 RepID=A0A830G975_9EURY|nr:hypothetical protein [Halarchaeum nitratireducens]GGN11827.1 hypothetical protein GCM10009021_09770 [Halarchaeum nitratireducens]
MAAGFDTSWVVGGFFVVLGGVVAAFSARYVWRALAVYRAMDADALDGVPAGSLVRVSGMAAGTAESLVAPFSGRPCVALRYAVEERRLSPWLLPWFVTVHERAGADAFHVRTPVTAVAVTAPPRSVVVGRDVVAQMGRTASPPSRVARFEREVDLPGLDVWRRPPGVLRPVFDALSLGARRYVEDRVEPGDNVTVVGRVTDDGSVDPLVMADRPRGATVVRMARTSLAGVLAGGLAIAIGLVLLA